MNEKIVSVIPHAEKWVEQVLEQNSKKHTRLNAYASMKYDGDRLTHSTVGTACYGGVGGYFGGYEDVLINWVASGNAMENWECSHGDGKNTFTRHELIKYFSYLARKSPYAKAFITKHAGNMVDKQYCIMDANLPGNLLIGALTAQRQSWEYTYTIRSWLLFRKRQPHVNPDWHFILANMIEMVTRPGHEVRFKWSPASSGHCPLRADSMSLQVAANFINHNLVGARNKNITQDRNYMGVQSLFGDRNDREENLLTILKEKVKKPKEKVDLAGSLFAWNTRFAGITDDDVNLFSLQDNLPVFEAFYNQNFGGNK